MDAVFTDGRSCGMIARLHDGDIRVVERATHKEVSRLLVRGAPFGGRIEYVVWHDIGLPLAERTVAYVAYAGTGKWRIRFLCRRVNRRRNRCWLCVHGWSRALRRGLLFRVRVAPGDGVVLPVPLRFGDVASRYAEFRRERIGRFGRLPGKHAAQNQPREDTDDAEHVANKPSDSLGEKKADKHAARKAGKVSRVGCLHAFAGRLQKCAEVFFGEGFPVFKVFPFE